MSDIVGPNGHPVSRVQLSIERTHIGGTEVEYQTDPRVGVAQIQPEAFGLVGIMVGQPPQPRYVFADPMNLLSVLISQINVNSALIRELLTQRAQITALQSVLEERAASAPTERIERHDVDDVIVE
jgi:hypothetical protein